MKIFTGAQIRELDKYTIEHEPITSEKLMERAATALTGAITERWPKTTRTVVFAGPGNNGGDALAVARMLLDRGYDVSTYLFNVTGHLSADCETNSKRLAAHRRAKDFTTVTADFNPPKLEEGTLVIDGLFGSGLRKPLSGGFASLVKYINQSPTTVVSIDMPSGLMTEDNTYNIHTNIIRADVTLTLQQKKLSMMFAENQEYIGRLEVLDIQLSAEYIDKTDCQCATIEPDMVVRHMRSRDSFAHKGDMGHALLIAGSYGMTGAAILAARACMRSGVGKLTVHTPRHNYTAMQISVPEALVHTDKENDCFSDSLDPSVYNAIGIGPGLGTNENTAMALISQIRRTQCPLVVDADALNILGTHRTWMQQLPEGLILTPHPKEFDRLTGNTSSGSHERLVKARDMAEQLEAFIILKGHYSALCTPDGRVLFNTTGNAGMATAGSGDVLTGIITGLLARGYDRKQACITGMYLHGLAGDIAAEQLGEECLMASDIINFIPHAFKRIKDLM
ncbi:MAG: NAD(P)H-hydrate dehydratase [Prevotella sp.]